MDAEAALRTALSADVTSPVEPAAYETIQRRARVRQWRNRVAVAGFGLAALVGVGVTVGPTETQVPSAVFASEDIEGGEITEIAEKTEGADADADVSADATPVPSPTATPEPDPPATLDVSVPVQVTPPEEADLVTSEPTPHLIVSDGAGGFVGVGANFNGNGLPNQLRRSADGETWTSIGSLDIGDFYISQLKADNGTFAAVLQRPTQPYASSVARLDAGRVKTYLALSADLLEFDLYELADLEPHELARAHTSLQDISVGADRIVVQTGTWIDIDRNELGLATAEFCGTVDDERGLFALHCDGSLIPILDRESQIEQGLDKRQQLFAIDDGDRLQEIEAPISSYPQLVATSAGWMANGLIEGEVVTSTDGETWEPVDTLPSVSDQGKELMWWVAASDGANQVLMVGAVAHDDLTRPGLEPVQMAIFDVVTGDVVMPPLVIAEGMELAFPAAQHGPGGWVIATVPNDSRSSFSIRQDGWNLWSAPPQGHLGRRFYAAPESPSGPVTPFEFRDRVSAVIDRGIFGELRFWNPGTEQVLIEADRNDTLAWTQSRSDRTADGVDGTVTVDGWIIDGDPILGPLRIASPGETERTYDDGFLFTNGTLDDGVEVKGEGLDFADFDLVLDDGEQQVTLPFGSVIAELTAEVAEDADDADDGPGEAHLFRLSDTNEWTRFGVVDGVDADDFITVLVGDDEALVIFGGQVVDPVRSVPFDD